MTAPAPPVVLALRHTRCGHVIAFARLFTGETRLLRLRGTLHPPGDWQVTTMPLPAAIHGQNVGACHQCTPVGDQFAALRIRDKGDADWPHTRPREYHHEMEDV